ncbi:MAG: DNA damage-inducible protein D [Phycisphaerae bacterium]|nr:DNA damage-inducible protein D [Phycisphaerae bacterium]
MKPEVITSLHEQFDARLCLAEDGPEFMYARDLQELLGYSDWKNFGNVVEKAKTSCQNSGHPVDDHFAEVGKMVDLGSGAKRQIEDVALTRYACYLVAQNADPQKVQVAFAQTYFAVQTRRQELVAQRIAEVERLGAREKLTESEKELSGVIFERLGGDGASFARIRSKGDAALFGGVSTAEMKKKLAVPDSRALADFLPTITIKAKDFANEVTNATIKKEDLRTEGQITQSHVKSNEDVRGILQSRGIAPENLPPAEDLKKVERRLASDTRKLPKSTGALRPKPEP